jgi:hypothetical protein
MSVYLINLKERKILIRKDPLFRIMVAYDLHLRISLKA